VSNTVIERVEFQTVAPKRALPGLEYTLNRLQALQTALKSTQAQLAGLSANAAFKLSAKQYQDRVFNAKGVPVLNRDQLSRRLGFDPKDVRAVSTLIETEIQSAIGKIQRAIDRSPAMGAKALAKRRAEIKALHNQSYFTDSTMRVFKNSAVAGRFYERYAGLALKDKLQGEKALAALLSGVMAGPNTYGGSITPTHLSTALKDAIAAAAGTAKAGAASETKKKKAKPQMAHEVSGQDVVETRVTTPEDPEKPIRTVVKRRTGAGVI